MFFKSKSKDIKPEATPAKLSSFLTKESKFEGNITTDDSVEINGEFIGNIESEKEVVINEFGSVIGSIKADRVVTNGKISGKIICNTFKGDKKSFSSEYIEATSVTIMGHFDGTIKTEELFVQEDGFVKNKIQATSIEISGKVEGDIACQTLSTTMHAKVKGKLFVNKLLNNGGSIDGSIGEYKDILTETKTVVTEKESKTDDANSTKQNHNNHQNNNQNSHNKHNKHKKNREFANAQ